jgi:hypothetical protein
MAQCVVCSCVTCPECGAWIVVQSGSAPPGSNDNAQKLTAICTVPDCGREFSSLAEETRIFELPLSLFERRHFYRSELLPSA